VVGGVSGVPVWARGHPTHPFLFCLFCGCGGCVRGVLHKGRWGLCVGVMWCR